MHLKYHGGECPELLAGQKGRLAADIRHGDADALEGWLHGAP